MFTYCFVSQVFDATIEIGGFAYQRRNVFWRTDIEEWSTIQGIIHFIGIVTDIVVIVIIKISVVSTRNIHIFLVSSSVIAIITTPIVVLIVLITSAVILIGLWIA